MRLKELREERELTQKELAQSIGVAQSNVSRWEKDEMEPSAEIVVKLADFFQVSADYLLGRSDDLGAPVAPRTEISREEQQLLKDFRTLSRHSRDLILDMIHSAAEKEQRA